MLSRALQILFSLLTVIAILAMAYAQYGIRIDPEDTRGTTILLIAALAAAIFLGRQITGESETTLEEPPSRGTLLRLAAAACILLSLFLVVAGSVLLAQDWRSWFATGWLLFGLGATGLSAALSLFDPPRSEDSYWSRPEVLALIAILAIGVFLRFYHYSVFPDPFSIHAIEEPQTGMGGYKILKHHTRPWEFFVDHYAAAAAIYLSGDPSILTIRIPFTIFSALTIIPVYLLLRRLTTKPAALAGTFLFAVSSWNIIYSRCAHNIFLTNFFVVIVLAILVAFGRTHRLAALPWAGLLCGTTLYAYAGYRGTSLFALLFMTLLFGRDLRRFGKAPDDVKKMVAARAVLRDGCAGALLLGFVVCLAVPVVAIVTSNPAQPWHYFEAANRSLANKRYYTHDRRAFVQQRLDRIRKTARIFMHKGDGSLTFNAPDEPMLDPVTSVCFIGGLLLAACYFWQGFNAFLLLMFLGILVGGAVFVQNLDVRRLQGVTPFVAVFAALFIDRLWALARRLPARLGPVLAAVLALVAGGTALAWNYNVYFNKMAKDWRVRQAFKNRYTTIIHYGRTAGAGREILLLSDVRRFFYPSDYYWLIDGVIHGRSLPDLIAALPPAHLAGGERPQSIVIQQPQEREAVARLLKQVYPGMHCREFIEPDNRYIALTTCDLPRNLMFRPWMATLHARYWLGSEPAGPAALERDEPFIGFAVVPPLCHGDPRRGESPFCSAEWSGTFTAPADGDYTFFLDVRGGTSAELVIDGRLVVSRSRRVPAGIRILLAAGEHTLLVRARLPRRSETGVKLEWAASGKREVLSFYATGDQASVVPSAAAA